MRKARVATVLAVAAAQIVLAPRVCRADAAAERKAAATVLFRDAKAMMTRGEIADACRRFEESQRLDPLPGTLLNLAVCHDKEGRTATAWVEFREALELAKRDGRRERIAFAESQIRALELRLCRVRIVVSDAADGPELRVALDGTAFERPAWGTGLPVDPGHHEVTAEAPGKIRFVAGVEVRKEGETTTITIDKLDAAPVAAPAPEPPPPIASPPPPPIATSIVRAPVAAPAPAVTSGSTKRTAAIAFVGAGAVGLGLGAYFGVSALGHRSDSDRGCPGGHCTLQGVADNDSAKGAADRATVAFGASLAFVGAAAYLWFSGAPQTPSRAIGVAPFVVPGAGGVAMAGRF